jgi:hypothetical protein
MTEREYPFRFAERCLYDYLENVARLEVLHTELKTLDAMSSARGQTYDGVPGSGSPSDAVSARLERIERVEQDILHWERRTKPIGRLLNDLESPDVLEDSPKVELLKILRLRYFGLNTWRRVQDAVGLGESTFARRRRELVDMAGRYLAVK